MAADGLAVGALDLAGAVRVDGQGPAQLVQDHMVVPPAVILEVGEASAAAVLTVGDVMGLAARGRLVAAAGELALLIPQRDQAPQVQRDLIGLAVVRVLYLSWMVWTLRPRTPRNHSSGQPRTRG